MKRVLLKFGIPSLDDLIAPPKAHKGNEGSNCESLAILGPDGTGKSVLALHLASRYAADCDRAIQKAGVGSDQHPRVLYISSDLRHESAEKVWDNFELCAPNKRHIPFERSSLALIRDQFKGSPRICLRPLTPDPEKLVEYLLDPPPGDERIGFLDLASHTAGDDWNLVNSLLVKLRSVDSPKIEEHQLSHLVIIDSVAGFETFVGRLDAYGNEQSRRARIAQCIRNAGKRVHLVFVVEEPHPAEHLPEEYVTDIVLRLRTKSVPGGAVRTVEVEKARAREHAKGEHPFDIRDREGTSTGTWENADTPRAGNAYVQVFHSIAHRHRLISADYARQVDKESTAFDKFGMRHLDELLAEGKGLKAGTATALIGDSGTRKSMLGERLLAQGFEPLVNDFVGLFLLRADFDGVKEIDSVKRAFGRVHGLLSSSILTKGQIKPMEGPIPANWFQELARSAALGRTATVADLKAFSYQSELAPDIREAVTSLEKRESASKLAIPQEKAPFAPGLQTRTPPISRAGWTLNWPRIVETEDLCELFRHPNLQYPGVLLTTSDQNGNELAKNCFRHLQSAVSEALPETYSNRYEELAELLKKILEYQLIVRRFDMQGLPSAAIFQIVHRNAVESQKLIFGIAYPPDRDMRRAKAGRVRFVIDDLHVLGKLNPEIVQDGAFLPFLTFFLQREGITSLIIHTDSLRPNLPPIEAVSQALIAILKSTIFTWNVPFEGRSRIAIGVTALNNARDGVVRELTVNDKGLPVVTRQFELYSGIEEGRPAPVPLAVYVFNETPQFQAYIEEEDKLFREMFSSVEPSSAVNPGRIIFPVDAARYMAMRDYTHLALDAQDAHTMIFQVDEFWALHTPHTLEDLSEYMDQPLTPVAEDRDLEDPFRLFAGAPLSRRDPGKSLFARRDYFRNSGYAPAPPSANDRSRVPFMWDFGFLLMRNAPWEIARSEPLFCEVRVPEDIYPRVCSIIPLTVGDNKVTVGEVRACLAKGGISWRKFFGACSQAAEVYYRQTGVATVPFDVASPSSETLNTLILEIWLSEVDIEAKILDYGPQKPDGKSLVKLLTYNYYGDTSGTETLFKQFKEVARNWDEDIPWETRVSEFRKLPLGAICLYKTWLLLIEALNFEDFLEPDNPFSFRQGRPASLHSVASRHWYKTASAFSSELYKSVGIDDSLVAARLPGHYSTRGDWFLASPKSSRSKLLAQRAIDLLCSRRANLTRMQRGLGLPVRDILDDQQCKNFRTALRCKQEILEGKKEQHLTELKYGDLVDLGEGGNIAWLRRSQIKDYDRLSRPLQKWLVRLFRWTGEYKKQRSRQWRGGFPGYDDLTCKRFSVVGSYDSFDDFGPMCDFLVHELEAAARPSSITGQPGPNDPPRSQAAKA
jgi:KaiC/GvpD/RAD55 family RecA-like ATPase